MNSTSTSWHSHLDETKRGLARLLARENLTVRHADVPTASFDLERRTLTLPKWTNITVDQYDLLIGHEVGHALFSDDIEAVKTSHQFPGLHTYINVLEDVRIERRVKEEFPGLRGSFRRGYRDFFEQGPIFQLEKPVDQYDFIDRINIHYKIGAHVEVPFSDDERLILARLDKCRTMQEVVALARELWSGQKKKNEESKQEQQSQPSAQSQPSSEPTEQSSESKSDSESDDSESDDSESDDSESDESESGDEPSESESDESESGAEPSESGTDPVAETDKFNSDAMSQMSRENSDSVIDHALLSPLPAEIVKACTVTNVQFVQDAVQHLSQRPERMSAATKYLATFQSKYGPTIAHMAREFDRRKTAKLHERARTARTGRIDMTKLASYKFREDIFQQITILPNGKSHGIVILIDGSGSMMNVFGDVMEQVMLFTQFAQRVNIPVQAYMFHNTYDGERVRSLLDAMPQYVARPQDVELVCLYDSSAPNLKQQQLVLAAVAFQWNGDRYESDMVVPHVRLTMTPLNGALLVVERHLANLKQTLRLEKMSLVVLTDGDATDAITYNGIRTSSYYQRSAGIYRDTVTRQVYANVEERKDWSGNMSGYALDNADGFMLVDSIRRRHDARVVRIHIAPSRDLRRVAKDGNYPLWLMVHSSVVPKVAETANSDVRVLGSQIVATAQASFKEKGQFTFSGPSVYYDALIVVSSNTLDLDEDDFESKSVSGWTARKIASEFTKSNVNAMKNRVFVNSVVPYLA